jgi:hypothetical protein
MADPAIMAEAQEQALGIFADAILKLALHIQQEAMVAEDLDQKVRAAGAVHQLGRGLRQTLALQSKLAREARQEAARPKPRPLCDPDDETPPDARTAAVRRRRDWLTRGDRRPPGCHLLQCRTGVRRPLTARALPPQIRMPARQRSPPPNSILRRSRAHKSSES